MQPVLHKKRGLLFIFQNAPPDPGISRGKRSHQEVHFMQQIKKQFSLFTAALVLAGSYGRIMPQSMLLATGNTRSVLELADALRADAAQPEEPFQELRYDSETGQLFQDGKPVGTEYAGFRICDGSLTVSDPDADGQQDTALTPDQAIRTIGCEISGNEDGDLVIRSPFQTARLIVRSEKTVDPHGGSITAEGFRDLHVIQYASAAEAYSAYLSFQQDSSIAFVQPDQLYFQSEPEAEAAVSPADYNEDEEAAFEKAMEEWGYRAVDTDYYLEWLKSEKTALPEIKVAVLDTGIYPEHEWFAGRIAAGGIDCSPSSISSTYDVQGHGTHCAGIICKSTPDSVKILPVKVLSDEGFGSDMSVYCGIMYAVEQHADVINMSLGGDGESPLLLEGLQAAVDADIACCVAAGNSAHNIKYQSPACFEDVFTISAVTWKEIYSNPDEPVQNDEDAYVLSDFSNFGSGVDFAAPGDAIFSAYPGNPQATAIMSGTSMAAPFASAACADLLSYQPELTSAEICELLKKGAVHLSGVYQDYTPEEIYGNGMICLNGIYYSHMTDHLPGLTYQVNGSDTDKTRFESDAPFSLMFSNQAQDTEIYYTTDGSEPSRENGVLFSGKPIIISESTLLRAAVCKGTLQSAVLTLRFQIGGKDTAEPFVMEDGVLKAYLGVLTNLDLTGYPLTEIGDDVFAQSDVLTLQLPDSVTRIGDRAFSGSSIRSLTAKGVTAVGEQAFRQCLSIDMKLGTLKEAGAYAFSDCFSTGGQIQFADSFVEIPEGLFQGSNVLSPDGLNWTKLTKIGDNAFEEADIPEELDLQSVQSIGKRAFFDASVLRVTLPEALTKLEDLAFSSESELERFRAPGLTELGTAALPNLSWWKPAMNIQIPFDKIRRIAPEGIHCVNFPEPVSFDALTDCAESAFYATTGATMIFPTLKEIRADYFDSTENLVWLPNAETITLQENPVTALRVSDSLKELHITELNNIQYLIGPEDSPAAAVAAEYGIPYYSPEKLTIRNKSESIVPNKKLELEARFVQDPDAEIEWYEVIDGEEKAYSDIALLRIGKLYDLSSCILSERPQKAGIHRYRAKLRKNGEVLDSADIMISVGVGTQKDENLYQTDSTAYDLSAGKNKTDRSLILHTNTNIYYDESKHNGNVLFASDHKCRVSLKAMNRNVSLTGILYSAHQQFGMLVSDTEFAELDSGFSELTLQTADNRSVYKTPLIYQLVEEQLSITEAEIVAEDAAETGAEITPKFRVSYNGELLTEGKDYTLEYETVPKAAGIYRILIKGCGDYYDEIRHSFRVLPKRTSDDPVLEDGTHTVRQDSGVPSLFRWNPQQTDYCLVKTSLPNSVLSVFTEEGELVSGFHGAGYQYQEIHVEAGKTYYVSVSNEYAEETGPVTFTLLSDYQMLDQCDIQIPALNPLGETPAVTITDGGKTLEQNTDFRIVAINSPNHLGANVVYIQGCGRYVGETEKTYRFYSPDPEVFPDADAEEVLDFAIEMQYAVPAEIPTTLLPGDAAICRFTSAYDGVHRISVQNHERIDYSVLVYCGEDQPILLEEPETELTFKKDQKITILVIADFMMHYNLDDYRADFSVTIAKPDTAREFESDGVVYETDGNSARIREIRPEGNVIRISGTVQDPETNAMLPVSEPDPYIFAPYASTLIILTDNQSGIAELCESYGYFVVRTDSESELTGDLTGDQRITYHDTYVLQCLLTEQSGIALNAAQRQAADCNQDGMIDMLDLLILLRKIAPPPFFSPDPDAPEQFYS